MARRKGRIKDKKVKEIWTEKVVRKMFGCICKGRTKIGLEERRMLIMGKGRRKFVLGKR